MIRNEDPGLSRRRKLKITPALYAPPEQDYRIARRRLKIYDAGRQTKRRAGDDRIIYAEADSIVADAT